MVRTGKHQYKDILCKSGRKEVRINASIVLNFVKIFYKNSKAYIAVNLFALRLNEVEDGGVLNYPSIACPTFVSVITPIVFIKQLKLSARRGTPSMYMY